jgi:hypothetical protein
MRILHLTLKKKWFDMILSGEKKEEYREIKNYWATRLTNGFEITNFFEAKNGNYLHEINFMNYDFVVFKNGYSKNAPTIKAKCLGIKIGLSKPECSDNWKGEVFVIKLGEIIEINNC